MPFYLPNSAWRKVGTAVGIVRIKSNSHAKVFFGATPGDSDGFPVSYSTEAGAQEFTGGSQDLWVKSADYGAAGVDGHRSALWIDGVGTFVASDVLPSRSVPFPPPTSANIQNVVFIGASLMEQTFGRNLATPNAAVTAAFQAAGLNVNVYGYGFSGATISGIRPEIPAALAAFPSNTLFVVHAGGNDVTNNRPFGTSTPTQRETIAANYRALLADFGLRKNDVVVCSATFRSYEAAAGVSALPNPRDAVFFDESLGSLPFNENIFIPEIAEWRPELINSDGNPVVDLYNITRNSYDSFLHSDGVHPTNPTGRNILINAMIARLGWIINKGKKPAPVVRRGKKLIVNFGAAPADFNGTSVLAANVRSAAAPAAPVLPILFDDGTPSPHSILVQHPGATIGTNTYNAVTTGGRNTGVPGYNGSLFNDTIYLSTLFADMVSGPLTITLSGFTPGALYAVSFAASRVSGDTRVTEYTDYLSDSVKVFVTSTPPPQPVTGWFRASAAGEIVITVRNPAGTSINTFAYINGLEIKPL